LVGHLAQLDVALLRGAGQHSERPVPVAALILQSSVFGPRTSDELAHLRIAMRTRAVIEQAKGILMERYKVSSADTSSTYALT